jgi:hypothetical protein
MDLHAVDSLTLECTVGSESTSYPLAQHTFSKLASHFLPPLRCVSSYSLSISSSRALSASLATFFLSAHQPVKLRLTLQFCSTPYRFNIIILLAIR